MIDSAAGLFLAEERRDTESLPQPRHTRSGNTRPLNRDRLKGGLVSLPVGISDLTWGRPVNTYVGRGTRLDWVSIQADFPNYTQELSAGRGCFARTSISSDRTS